MKLEIADVRRLGLSPSSFRTPLAGLFLFVPSRIDHKVCVAMWRAGQESASRAGGGTGRVFLTDVGSPRKP